MSTTKIKRVAQHQTPAMIRDGEEFDASNFTGRRVSGLGPWDGGRLYGRSAERFRADVADIRYVVFSYATPVAWLTVHGEWHIVTEKFGTTTSTKHQSRLYLIPHAAHQTNVVLIARGQGWRVVCGTCRINKVDDATHTSRRSAEDHAHYHRLNGDRKATATDL